MSGIATSGIRRRDVIRYAVLPGLRPRLADLFLSGFQYISFFMALVYQGVRLLPDGHPYCNPANIGRFGIRHVIAEAANNLVISRKNIDQIVLFFTLLFGVIIVLIQVLMLGMSFFAGPVMAAALPTNFLGFFQTPLANRPHDLAFMMFDLIFGIPNNSAGTPMFGSCFNPSVAVPCQDDINRVLTADSVGGPQMLAGLGWPFPIHQGLHAMFMLYNTGLLVVAALISVYYIMTIILETAQSGTPFGKRFNKVWAPIRYVIAFGLLIPFGLGAGAGLNSSQFMVLYAAKFGSSFATNGWAFFNNTLVGGYLGQVNTLISNRQVPEVSSLLQFLFAANTCRQLEQTRTGKQIYMFAVKENNIPVNASLIYYRLGGAPAGPFPAGTNTITNYTDLITFANGDRQVVFRFGYKDAVNFPREKGNVAPICGELTLPLKDPRISGSADPPERSAEIMQAYYYSVVKELFYAVYEDYTGCGGCAPQPEITPYRGQWTYNYMRRYTQWYHDPNAPLPPPEYRVALQNFYSTDIQAAMTNPPSRSIDTMDPVIGAQGAIAEGIASGRWAVPPALLRKGWAAAGIWYNRVAELNGAVSGAMLGLPFATAYPMVMEYVKEKKRQQNQNIGFAERFRPSLAAGDDVPALRPEDTQMQVALWEAFNYWQSDGGATTTHTTLSGNPIYDLINDLFGTSGLYSMRTQPAGVTIHPLAQLVGVGRSLIDAAVNSFMMAGAAAFGGKTFDAVGGTKIGGVVVSLAMTLVSVCLTTGFLLYYIVPFLPFIYFFFAVGAWFKAIFQAMVGAPLWALAHLRIDGHGLAGPAAANGYFLILEIFLRPILMIFGLLGAISIFAALVSVLNQVWDLVTANLTGFDVQSEVATPSAMRTLFRGPIDEFFFTIIYTIVVYIMAMSCFKLIDLIPGNILRWMGQSIMVFNDSREDAGQSLMGTASVGAQQGIGKVTSGVSGALNKIMQVGGTN